MHVVVTADLHGLLPEIPPCDLLLVAGDLTGGGSKAQQLVYLHEKLEPWIREAPANAVAAVAGNHDFLAESNPQIFRDLPWVYLQDEGRTIDVWVTAEQRFQTVKIWGSPRSKQFGGWAFMQPDHELAAVWATIPDDVEILMVHDPAHGLQDRVWSGEEAGSFTLRQRIDELAAGPHLQLFCCGHIHEAYGKTAIPRLMRGDSSTVESRVVIPVDVGSSPAPLLLDWIQVVNGAHAFRANPPISVELYGGDLVSTLPDCGP